MLERDIVESDSTGCMASTGDVHYARWKRRCSCGTNTGEDGKSEKEMSEMTNPELFLVSIFSFTVVSDLGCRIVYKNLSMACRH